MRQPRSYAAANSFRARAMTVNENLTAPNARQGHTTVVDVAIVGGGLVVLSLPRCWREPDIASR